MEVLNTHSVAILEKLVFSVFPGLKKVQGHFFLLKVHISLWRKVDCLFCLSCRDLPNHVTSCCTLGTNGIFYLWVREHEDSFIKFWPMVKKLWNIQKKITKIYRGIWKHSSYYWKALNEFSKGDLGIFRPMVQEILILRILCS